MLKFEIQTDSQFRGRKIRVAISVINAAY